MKTKHTSGPWKSYQYGQIFTVGADDGNLRIADEIKVEANARLIASAPELLAALQKCIEEIESSRSRVDMENKGGKSILSSFLSDIYIKVMDSAKPAISKATGEEKP